MWAIFKDKNEYNEKSIIGFISFAIMVMFGGWLSWEFLKYIGAWADDCLLYTSPSPRDGLLSRMPSSA